MMNIDKALQNLIQEAINNGADVDAIGDYLVCVGKTLRTKYGKLQFNYNKQHN